MNFESPPDSPSFNSYTNLSKRSNASPISHKFQNQTRNISSFTTRIDDMITAATSKVTRGSGSHHRLINESDLSPEGNKSQIELNSIEKNGFA